MYVLGLVVALLLLATPAAAQTITPWCGPVGPGCPTANPTYQPGQLVKFNGTVFLCNASPCTAGVSPDMPGSGFWNAMSGANQWRADIDYAANTFVMRNGTLFSAVVASGPSVGGAIDPVPQPKIQWQPRSTPSSPTFSAVTAGVYQIGGTPALAFSATDTVLVGEMGLSNTGSDSVMVGFEGGNNNTADEQVFIGYQAGFANTVGVENLFLGTWAGRDNTTGGGNTYLGYMAGRTNILGQQNTYVGWGVRSSITTGSFNTFMGYQAGGEVSVSGDHNTAMGAGSGEFNGSWNVGIGQNAGSGVAAASSSISIGAGAFPAASNQLVMGGDVLGNGRITSAYIGQGVTNATPATVTLNTTGGAGSNIAGAAFNLAPGISTGSATPSSLVFFTSTPGGSGATPQANVQRWRIDGAFGGYLIGSPTVGLIIPSLKSNSGTRFICVDTSGQLVSQTTACVGT